MSTKKQQCDNSALVVHLQLRYPNTLINSQSDLRNQPIPETKNEAKHEKSKDVL